MGAVFAIDVALRGVVPGRSWICLPVDTRGRWAPGEFQSGVGPGISKFWTRELTIQPSRSGNENLARSPVLQTEQVHSNAHHCTHETVYTPLDKN